MRTVEKALDILESVQKHEDGLSLANLANKTGLNLSTVHRLSSILVKRNYLYQKEKRGKYSLGYKFSFVNGIVSTAASIREQAFPYLQKLRDDTSETADLAILDGIEPVDIAICPNHNPILQVVPTAGTRFPLHCTAFGKLLLAFMSKEQVQNIMSVIRLTAYTEKTITDKAQLLREIENIRRKGVAFDKEEYYVGVMCIAAPVKGEDGKVIAAVSIVGPSVRIGRLKMRQLTPIVTSCALEISRSLGYNDGLMER